MQYTGNQLNMALFLKTLLSRNSHRWALGLSVAVALMLLSACEQSSQLERIQQKGELWVASRIGPTTYFQHDNQPAGIEYELIKRFADSLGVKARWVFPADVPSLLQQTEYGVVDMAAAGLTLTPERQRSLRFSEPYQHINEVIVYRRGDRKPRKPADIKPGYLHLLADSSHEESLNQLKQKHPELEWVSHTTLTSDQMLQAVNDGRIHLTTADNHELAAASRVYRYLTTAFGLSEEKALAWAFPPSSDGSLLQAANAFLTQLRNSGELERLLERYYGHAERMNFVDKRDFRRHVRERLPHYRELFQKAAKAIGWDWRLLAAISYQESHWRPKAVSPTGVKGLMMLTRATAKQVGVKDRTNPQQSIDGGARYLQILERKIPQRIQGSDRTWLMLASYNIGFGHLEDARILTQRQGGNPDHWKDVKQRLPLLSKKRYYKTLKRGFARGGEAFNYVENIRNYYDLLIWYEMHPELLQD